jgi:phosphoglucosamine mutase
LADRGCTLATVADELEVSPQVLVNVPVRVKRNLEEIEPVQAILTRIERALADRGRLVVRYSGTESLLRVMLEGPDESLITAWANEIAQAVREHLG